DVSRHRNTTHVLTGTAAAHEQAIGALLADGWDEDTKVLLGWGISTIEQTSVETTLKQALSMTQTGSDRMVVIMGDRKSTRLNSSHVSTSYAVFCLKKKTRIRR